MTKTTHNAQETMALARELHEQYPEHSIWLLYGDLGAGKTTFVKGLSESLGLTPSQIKSPTFTFVSEYDPLVHYDLYRLETLDALTLELIQEHRELGRKMVIEWPEKIEHFIKEPHLRIYFKHEGEDQRSVEVVVNPPLED